MKVQALILAGGEGKRYQPLTNDKNTLSFLGKSLLEYNIDDLIAAGVKDIMVVVSRRNQTKVKYLLKNKGAKIRTVIQIQPKGMADAVLSAAKSIKASQPLLIINGSDLLAPQVFKNFLAQAKKETVALGAIETEAYLPGGYFKVKNGQAVGLVEKPKLTKRPSNLVKLVLDYFSRPAEFIQLLKQLRSSKDDLYEVALDKLMAADQLKALAQSTYLGQIKYSWMVLKMMNLIFEERFKSKISKQTSISKQAIIRGPVIIEKGVRIFEGATIIGPAYLAEGVVIGNDSMVRHSHIGPGCVIGSGSEVVRSYIGDHCWLHRNYVGDSILEANVSLGAGTVTANLRLDEAEVKVRVKGKLVGTGMNKLGAILARDVRVGVNAALMPGRLIGSGCFVGPGVVLNQDLEPNTSCLLKQNLTITKQRTKVKAESRSKFRQLI